MLGIPWANLNKLTLQHHVAAWKTQRCCKIVACLLQFQQGSTKKPLSHSRLPWFSWMQTAAAATSRRTRCFSENAILQTQAGVWARDWSKFLERERKLHKSLWGEKWKSPGAASPFYRDQCVGFPTFCEFPSRAIVKFPFSTGDILACALLREGREERGWMFGKRKQDTDTWVPGYWMTLSH